MTNDELKLRRPTTGNVSDELPAEADGEPRSLRVQIADEQTALVIDASQLQLAVRRVLWGASYNSGLISVAVVDDPTIHKINRQYLEHDYPTDVLSFALEDREPYLEGELVVSTETAVRNAAEYGWPAESELLLYVIHGALHLVGFRDKKEEEMVAMRAAEMKHLAELGIAVPGGSTRWSAGAESNETGEEARSL